MTINWRTRLGLLILGGMVVALLAALALVAFPLGRTSSPPLPNLTGSKLPVTPRPDGQVCWDSRWMGGWAWPTTVRAEPPLAASGIGYGIADGDISDSIMLGYHTFQVKANIPLTAKLHVWYPRTEINTGTLNLRYLVLLDEKQLIGAIGPSSAPYADVGLRPDDEITMTISLPPLASGLHELIVVGLMNAADEPDNLGIMPIGDLRVTLLAGGSSQPLARTYLPLSAAGSVARNDPVIPLHVSQADGSLKAWNWPESRLPVPAGKPVEFAIYAGYAGPGKRDAPPPPGPEWMEFALFVFMDYRQVDVKPGARVFYGQVPRDAASARILSQVEPPAEPGRHDILVLRVDYPGHPMCVLLGPPDGQIFPFLVRARRVAIEVR